MLYFDFLKFSKNQDKEFRLRPMLFQSWENGNEPGGYLPTKMINRNTRTCCKIWLKLTIKTPEPNQWRHLVSLLLTLNRFGTLFYCFYYYYFKQVHARCDISSCTFTSEKIFYTFMLTCEQGEIYFLLITLIKKKRKSNGFISPLRIRTTGKDKCHIIRISRSFHK